MARTKYFLTAAKHRSKKLFILLWLIIAITAITFLAGLQITPFLLYGMYSSPEPHHQSFETYSLEYDGETYNEPQIWNYHKKAMFNFTIEQYLSCKENNYHDYYEDKTRNILNKVGLHNSEKLLQAIYNCESDIKRYPQWLKQYMSKNIGKPIHEMKVYKIEMRYNEIGKCTTIKKNLIFSN